MKISEIFDTPYPVDLSDTDRGNYVFRTKLPDGSPLSITFEKYDAASYSVAFSKNFQYDATDEGDAYKIFATVLNTIKRFIAQVKPYEISFLAEKETDAEGGADNSRVRLYDRMVKKYADRLGYKLVRKSIPSAINYVLRRIR
jgi:hypothetical protein